MGKSTPLKSSLCQVSTRNTASFLQKELRHGSPGRESTFPLPGDTAVLPACCVNAQPRFRRDRKRTFPQRGQLPCAGKTLLSSP